MHPTTFKLKLKKTTESSTASYIWFIKIHIVGVNDKLSNSRYMTHRVTLVYLSSTPHIYVVMVLYHLEMQLFTIITQVTYKAKPFRSCYIF